MAKSNYMTTIAIDTERSVFHFYSMTGGDKTIAHNIKGYSGGLLEEGFIDKFREALREFAANNPSDSVRKVSLIIPDSAVVLDTVKLPTIKGSAQMQKALDVTLSGIYRNYADLHTVCFMADQNKQYSTFVMSAVQKKLLSDIYAACSENKMMIDTLTFTSNAAACGASVKHTKLRYPSYLLLDIKDVYSRFIFVAKGKTVGYYTLPFGTEFLEAGEVIPEDMLFDHSLAALTVLNAKERARNKKLTAMALGMDDPFPSEHSPLIDTDPDTEDLLDEADEEDAAHTFVLNPASGRKTFMRKSPRKLPKFMQREIPETEEGIAYENFRVFMKWALTLIDSNEKLTALGAPECVCVNIPKRLSYLTDEANRELANAGVRFVSLPYGEEDEKIASNLELYGGFFPRQMSEEGKF